MSLTNNTQITKLTNLRVQPVITGTDATPKASALYAGLGVPVFPVPEAFPLVANSREGDLAVLAGGDVNPGTLFLFSRGAWAQAMSFIGSYADQTAIDELDLTDADWGEYVYNIALGTIEYWTAAGWITMESSVAAQRNYGGISLTTGGTAQVFAAPSTFAKVTPASGATWTASALSGFTATNSNTTLTSTVSTAIVHPVSMGMSVSSDTAGTVVTAAVRQAGSNVNVLTRKVTLAAINTPYPLSVTQLVTVANTNTFEVWVSVDQACSLTYSDCTLAIQP